MERITIETNKDLLRWRNKISYTIPKGTKFEVDKIEFNNAKKANKYIFGLPFLDRNQAIKAFDLDKVTTPLEYTNNEIKPVQDSIIQIQAKITHYVSDKDNRNKMCVNKGERFDVSKFVWEYEYSNVIFIPNNKNLKLEGKRENFELYNNKIKEQPLTPEECFKDEYITIECINNSSFIDKLTIGKRYKHSKKDWEDRNLHYTTGEAGGFERKRFKIIPNDKFYQKILIELKTSINPQPNDSIPIGTTFEVDLDRWAQEVYVTINWKGKPYTFDKYYFKAIKNIDEEAGQFPSIPSNVDDCKPNIGKVTIFGTAGKDNSYKNFWDLEEANINSITKITPEDYDKIALSFPSRNEVSQRDKPWQDQVEKMSEHFNPFISKEDFNSIRGPFNHNPNNIFPTEALKNIIDEINRNKLLSFEKVGIVVNRQGNLDNQMFGRTPIEKSLQFAEAYGMSIPKQIEYANKLGLLWNDNNHRVLGYGNLNEVILNHNDSVHTIYTPSRRMGVTWSFRFWEEYLKSLLKTTSPFKNITIPKRIKKKKQIIVESMNNIKL